MPPAATSHEVTTPHLTSKVSASPTVGNEVQRDPKTAVDVHGRIAGRPQSARRPIVILSL
jgi:hypothetical protein